MRMIPTLLSPSLSFPALPFCPSRLFVRSLPETGSDAESVRSERARGNGGGNEDGGEASEGKNYSLVKVQVWGDVGSEEKLEEE